MNVWRLRCRDYKKKDNHERFDLSDIWKRGENTNELENQIITNTYINKVLEKEKISLIQN